MNRRSRSDPITEDPNTSESTVKRQYETNNLYHRKYKKLKLEPRNTSLHNSSSKRHSTSAKKEYEGTIKSTLPKDEDSFNASDHLLQGVNEVSSENIEDPSQQTTESAEIEKKKEPNFDATGILASETSLQNGILLKHNPPSDSRKPDKNWRLYMFKKGEKNENSSKDSDSRIFHIHRNPTYLFGKEVRVADIPLFHPTISKQHAVIQFRSRNNSIRPYLIDLESTNGTFLNDDQIDPSRYYELRERDIIRFGNSSREFILLNTDSVISERKDYKTYLNQIEER